MFRWFFPALFLLSGGCPFPAEIQSPPLLHSSSLVGFDLSAGNPPAKEIFPFGVASGDPLADAVILWTMLDTLSWKNDSLVHWEVSRSPNFSDISQRGQTIARRGRRCRVKIDVQGLTPGTVYYYRFQNSGKFSSVGRTRTTSRPEQTAEVKLAVVSCNALEWGYMNAFEQIAVREDLAAVVHLGDYIYEYASGVYGDTSLGRFHEPRHEVITEQDYHQRYAQYRRDPQLRAAHEAHPFICVWDDHEVANNSYLEGAENHNVDEGNYLKRMTAAKQVYYDWMPIREQASGAIYRRFSFGSTAELHMLDERLAGRDAPAESFAPGELADTNRHMLGTEQFEWLCAGLSNSTARWQLLGNQVLFAPLDLSNILPEYAVNLDAWDGYAYEQGRLLDSLSTYANPNTIFLTGDTHCSWYFDVNDSAGDRIAAEFGTPSVSSANYDEFIGSWDTLTVARYRLYRDNDHLHYTNIKDHGYLLLDLRPEEVKASFHFSRTIRTRDPRPGHTKSFTLPYANDNAR